MKQAIVVGQRWISHNESHLGLGMVQTIDGRRVEIFFPAVNESRHYAIDNAPISRILYATGDVITDMDDCVYRVLEANEHKGLCIYFVEDEQGQQKQLTELQLNSFVQFSAPDRRLLSGQIDTEQSYKLRYQTLVELDRLQQSPVAGLLGARVDLLPHQIYIAHEVANRFAPRVLLADEVGLGKTIEAGLIMHQQLSTGRASRALIMVPESLVYQWLVEMLRRFNLKFALFDQSRFEALKESPDIDLDTGETVNPFEMEQLVICSIDAMVENAEMQQQLLQTHWDITVVDEAHHLHWQQDVIIENEEQESCSEEIKVLLNDYQLVEQIACRSTGLLLLTATPSQAGIDSHFARLRLLDPERFYDLEAFKNELNQSSVANELIDLLVSEETVAINEIEALWPDQQFVGFKNELSNPLTELDKTACLDRLIDQHGMGRILFRNSRAAMKNFPARNLNVYPLACPEIYFPEDDAPMHLGIAGLTPEVHLDPECWLSRDPRVNWLVEKLLSLKDKKVLVIAHHASTAIALQDFCAKKHAIRCSAFHEHLNLFERDRAAAYFSEKEQGAQVLFCSEIGSEGRNFQFAHHLVLFDLPSNPDLLEQRIGRLDRIGQLETIQIHVPYLQNSSSEVLFDWYHQGMNLFLKSFSAGFALFEAFSSELNGCMNDLNISRESLIESTQARVKQIRHEMEQGRDQLLELNSCRQPKADNLVEQVETEEKANALASYFQLLLEEFGVDQEEHSALSWVLRPSEHMKHSYFPGLNDEGNTVTLDRLKALSRDDIEFLSWEHPMVAESMEMMVKGDAGSTSVGLIKVKGLKPGTLLLEAFYTLNTIAPKALQVNRYLSQKPIRCLVDASGKNLSQVVNHNALNGLSQPLKRKVAIQVIEQVKPQVESLLKTANSVIEGDAKQFKLDGIERVDQLLGAEKQRLIELQSFNKNIRTDEIEAFDLLSNKIKHHIEKSSLQLQGLRLLVAS